MLICRFKKNGLTGNFKFWYFYLVTKYFFQ